MTRLVQRYRQQAADQRLAHAALAAHHGDDAVDLVQLLGRALVLVRHADADAALFLIGHLGQFDLHRLDILQGPHRAPDIARNLIFERTAQGRQGQDDLYTATLDPHLADHTQFNEAFVQLGIHDPFECLTYVCFCDQSSVPPSGL